jgi:hypothetical protein
MLPILRMLVTDSLLRRSQDHSAAIGNFAGTRGFHFGSGLRPRFLTGDGGVELRSVVDDRVELFDQRCREKPRAGSRNCLWRVAERARWMSP